ncbi:hypothetical protein ACFFRR_009660 [Megaselia abdita]
MEFKNNELTKEQLVQQKRSMRDRLMKAEQVFNDQKKEIGLLRKAVEDLKTGESWKTWVSRNKNLYDEWKKTEKDLEEWKAYSRKLEKEIEQKLGVKFRKPETQVVQEEKPKPHVLFIQERMKEDPTATPRPLRVEAVHKPKFIGKVKKEKVTRPSGPSESTDMFKMRAQIVGQKGKTKEEIKSELKQLSKHFKEMKWRKKNGIALDINKDVYKDDKEESKKMYLKEER